MPDSDLDPWDFSLSQDEFSGSANAKFQSQVCVFTDWAKMPSVTRLSRDKGVPVTHSVFGTDTVTAITAWHCVSSVNTDDSRQTELYYNFTKLQ